MEMNNMNFTSSQAGVLLGQGSHPVTISEIKYEEKEGVGYNDKTPQLKVLFVTDDKKFFSEWYNMVGFLRHAELPDADKASGRFAQTPEGIAIDRSTGNRVRSEKRTTSSQNIFGALGNAAGIPLLTNFKPTEIIGKKVVIDVQPNNMKRLTVASVRPVGQASTPVANPF